MGKGKSAKAGSKSTVIDRNDDTFNNKEKGRFISYESIDEEDEPQMSDYDMLQDNYEYLTECYHLEIGLKKEALSNLEAAYKELDDMEKVVVKKDQKIEKLSRLYEDVLRKTTALNDEIATVKSQAEKEKKMLQCQLAESVTEKEQLQSQIDDAMKRSPHQSKDLLGDYITLSEEFVKEREVKEMAQAQIVELTKTVAELEAERSMLVKNLTELNNKLDGANAKLLTYEMKETSLKTGLDRGESSSSAKKRKGSLFMAVRERPQQNLRRSQNFKEVPKVSNFNSKKVFDTDRFYGCCYHCGKFGHRIATCKFREKSLKMANRFDALSRDVVCYSCGEIGHMVAQCYSRLQSRTCARDVAAYRPQQRKLVCYNCKNEGHTKRDCKIGDLNLLTLRRIEEHLNSKMDSCQPVKKVWQRKENQIVKLSDKDDTSESVDKAAAVATYNNKDKDGGVSIAKVPHLCRRFLGDSSKVKGKQVVDDDCDSDDRDSLRSSCYGEGETECFF